MPKFYFTYGTSGHPYKGGWTVVEADTITIACGLFDAYHPRKHPACMNCACVYPEDKFLQSPMSKNGNFGEYCHEYIKEKRTVYNNISRKEKNE